VKSRTTRHFRELFTHLPESVQQAAKRAYKLFLANPDHPGLHFKQVDPQRKLYSVRIGRDFRALGVRNKNRIVWIWIGKHSDYDRMLR
jgi:hypothetical protein